MKTVFKYELDFRYNRDGPISLRLPHGHVVRHVGHQGCEGVLCLWVEVDTDLEQREVKFYAYGTGHNMYTAANKTFVGTVMQGVFVWHVYEETT